MDDSTRNELAQRLAHAYADGPVDPVSQLVPSLTVQDAYAVQQHQLLGWVAGGRTIVGRKVGLTSAAMQRQLGVDQPDHGVLLDDMILPDHAQVPVGRFLQPRIEPEIAFVLERDLTGPGVTVAAAARAVAFVLPALEVIDSRIRDWKITIVDTVADNASSAAVVLGGHPTCLDAHDLRLLGANLHLDGAVVASGAGGAVLGSPVLALCWLANTLGAVGEGLRAGDVVLPGSLTAAQPVRAGQSWTASFAHLGTVSISFTSGGIS